jgi:hypothetical protein
MRHPDGSLLSEIIRDLSLCFPGWFFLICMISDFFERLTVMLPGDNKLRDNPRPCITIRQSYLLFSIALCTGNIDKCSIRIALNWCKSGKYRRQSADDCCAEKKVGKMFHASIVTEYRLKSKKKRDSWIKKAQKISSIKKRYIVQRCCLESPGTYLLSHPAPPSRKFEITLYIFVWNTTL